MRELINGRTEEEIKRELRWAVFTCGSINCEDCEYYESIRSHTTDERLAPDALALIERLTIRTKHSAVLRKALNPKGGVLRKAIRKLADYEDTGLTPEEIQGQGGMIRGKADPV